MTTNELTHEYDERFMRAGFDSVSSFTLGAEEEILLLDPATGLPMPAIELALELFAGDARVASEFRAAQVEIVTPVSVAVADVVRELAAVRRLVGAGLTPETHVAAVGAHPISTDSGPITRGARYEEIAVAQPWAARQLLTCGTHVHVALGGADRALAVHNAMRSYLPELVALGANAPFHAGADSRFATTRPFLNRALSRHGVPPAFETWADLAAFLAWGAQSTTLPDASYLWWDLRLRPATGTIEVRAADAQTRVEDTAAIVALTQCLVYDLAGRYDAGEPLPVHDRDRIGESMFAAARDGVFGLLPDLESGDPAPASQRLLALADRLTGAAAELGCSDELDHVRCLVLAGGGATRQRSVVASDGIGSLVRFLVDETASSAAAASSAATADAAGERLVQA